MALKRGFTPLTVSTLHKRVPAALVSRSTVKTPNFTIICPEAVFFFFLFKNRALGSGRGWTEGWRCLATDIGRNATTDGIPGPPKGGV